MRGGVISSAPGLWHCCSTVSCFSCGVRFGQVGVSSPATGARSKGACQSTLCLLLQDGSRQEQRKLSLLWICFDGCRIGISQCLYVRRPGTGRGSRHAHSLSVAAAWPASGAVGLCWPVSQILLAGLLCLELSLLGGCGSCPLHNSVGGLRRGPGPCRSDLYELGFVRLSHGHPIMRPCVAPDPLKAPPLGPGWYHSLATLQTGETVAWGGSAARLQAQWLKRAQR